MFGRGLRGRKQRWLGKSSIRPYERPIADSEGVPADCELPLTSRCLSFQIFNQVVESVNESSRIA